MSESHVEAMVPGPAPPLLIHLSADVPGKAAHDAISTLASAICAELEFLAPATGLAQSWPSLGCYGHLRVNQKLEDEDICLLFYALLQTLPFK